MSRRVSVCAALSWCPSSHRLPLPVPLPPPPPRSHLRFEVTWIAEDHQSDTVNYVQLALVMQAIEVLIEFLASATMPLIFRAVQCTKHMTSKQLAQFALKAYTVSNFLALIIYPPIMIVTYWIGDASLKTRISSIIMIACGHAVQYAFINQVGDASVEMARPHWLRTVDGASLVFPGFPLLCCCDRAAVKCRRAAHESRRREALGEDFDEMAEVMGMERDAPEGAGCCCAQSSDVETIHARYSLNLVAAATPATLSVYVTMLRFLLFALLGTFYTVAKRNVVLRFGFIMVLALVNSGISLLLWLNMETMVKGIIDEDLGEAHDDDASSRAASAVVGGGLERSESLPDYDRALDEEMKAAALLRKKSRRTSGFLFVVDDEGKDAFIPVIEGKTSEAAIGGDGRTAFEDGGDLLTSQSDDIGAARRGCPRLPWQMRGYELMLVFLLVLIFSVPGQAMSGERRR